MDTNSKGKQAWFTVFRTDEQSVAWLYDELKCGRLRQGWGRDGLSLRTPDGEAVEKGAWEEAYRSLPGWGEPSPRRFAILQWMLEMEEGSIVVVPKMPTPHEFTIARVNGSYTFSMDEERGDFGHIVPVDPTTVRTFAYRANDEAYDVSALFAKANHRPPVSFACAADHVKAAGRLLGLQSSRESQPEHELRKGQIAVAYREAAKALSRETKKWNGHRFEEAVKDAFENLGWRVIARNQYDRKGGDVDLVVQPLGSQGLFLPDEIAVQVKWKHGTDYDDVTAIVQIERWATSRASNATKFVISSADRFTQDARKAAKANDVVLVGGMQTMCFLLGISEHYREDWDDLDADSGT